MASTSTGPFAATNILLLGFSPFILRQHVSV